MDVSLINLPSKTTLPEVIKAYTPSNWSKEKALYAITFQGKIGSMTGNSTAGTEQNPFTITAQDYGSGFNSETQTYMFVFDAIMRASHRINAEITQHPVQTGYNITDHVIMQPMTLTLEVAMSDAISMYTLPGFSPMWGNNPSKSVAAFLQMKLFMKERQVMTVNTRLYTYDNMVLREISVEDSPKTYFGGLAMVLTFQEIIVADIAAQVQSQRIQSIGETTQGTVNGTVSDPTTVEAHTMTEEDYNTMKLSYPGGSSLPTYNASQTVPGAGLFTSQLLQSALHGLM
jgi:hypothetical protein